MDLRDRNALVTGAGGFIGSHLVNRLVDRGCHVRALLHYNSRGDHGNLGLLDAAVKNKVEIVLGDVRDPHAMQSIVDGCDVVFHLAALIGIPYSYVAPASYVSTNVVGTLNVLEACKKHRVARLIHTSTSECYGTAIYTPIDEKHPLQAQSPYSASKIGADKLAESYHRSFDLPVSILRPFNTYGPRQSNRAIIPTIVRQILFGGDEIKLGSLYPKRDFLFVKDTCEAFCKAAESEQAAGKTLHIGTGSAVSIGELVELLMQITGTRKTVNQEAQRVRPEGSEVGTLICDAAYANELIGWTPRVPLEDGLRQVISHIATLGESRTATNYAI